MKFIFLLMIYIPVLSAIALGAGTIFEKIALKKRSITPVFYTATHFIFIVLAMLPIIYFFWHIDIVQTLKFKNIIYFLIVVGLAILANFFIFKSYKGDNLNNLEPAQALQPLFVILLAILFSFIYGTELFERNTNVIVPSLIAGGALIFSHVKKHHLRFNKYFIFAILGSFLFALELVFSKLILSYYSSMTFYFLRCVFAFGIGFVIFRPKFAKIDSKILPYYIGAGISWVGYRVLMYYGYQELGVILTTLVLMLGPIIILTMAHFFLKEKMNWKSVIASIIIVCCIAYAILF